MTKVSKIRNIAVRLVLVALSWSFIAWQISSRDNLDSSFNLLQQRMADHSSLSAIALVLLLMVLNWLTEALKWRRLMHTVQPVTTTNAVIAVLTGVSVSVFTPNRVGEFLGRVFSIRVESPLRAILVTLVGSMSQLLVTIVAGSIASLFFAGQYSLLTLELPASLRSTVVVITLVANLLIVALFLNVPFLTSLLRLILPRRWRRIRSYVRVFSRIRRVVLLQVLSMSFIRYLLFSLQFLLLLRLFGITASWTDLWMLVCVIWFVMAAIPSFALTELGIRSSVSVAVFTVYTGGTITPAQTMALVASSSLLWLVNIALPAVTGTFFINRLKIPSSARPFHRS